MLDHDKHIHKKASSNSKVYKKLREISKKGISIKASLISSSEIMKYFYSNTEKLSDNATIDIFEQVLIHHLHPIIQDS